MRRSWLDAVIDHCGYQKDDAHINGEDEDIIMDGEKSGQVKSTISSCAIYNIDDMTDKPAKVKNAVSSSSAVYPLSAHVRAALIESPHASHADIADVSK